MANRVQLRVLTILDTLGSSYFAEYRSQYCVQLQLECNIACIACTQVRKCHIHFQPAAKGPARRLASAVPFLFDKNKELWTELGPAVTAKIGYEGNSKSI